MLTRHPAHEILPGPTQTASPLPDREAQANAEVGQTDISCPLAWTLSVLLLLIIVAVPVAQHFRDRQMYEIFRAVPAAGRAFLAHEGTLWGKAAAANQSLVRDIQAYEEALQDQSLVSAVVRPPTQVALTRWLGAGNEKVYVGRDGWLFYRPDIELLSNPPKADPLPAIRDFHRQLKARGIQLVLLPAPAKPMVCAGKVIYPRWWPVLRNQLETEGILFLDAAPLAREYLKTDTHWRPETMETVAVALATLVRPLLPAVGASDYSETTRTVTNRGDTAAMLAVEFPPEMVSIRPVRVGGARWEPRDQADVLLLGDSFANIYSFGEMRWGTGAGLAERLSFHLHRPLDVLARNDDGAYATRLMLAQQPEKLAGKRVVIWEFAARELANGDWKQLPLGPARE